MPSIARTGREASARDVINALTVHQELVARGVADSLKDYLPADKQVLVPALMAAMARALTDATDKMVQADAKHEAELADDPAYREARDQAKATLRESLMALRDGLIAMESGANERFGLKEGITDSAQAVLSLATDVLAALENKNIAWPKPTRKGLALNRADFVGYLKAEIPPMKEALDNVAREKREAEATLAVKDLAMEAYDQTFIEVANLGWALFRMGNQHKLADRIKPSQRRPGRTAAREDEPETPEGPVE